jgi:hypothetical protein
MYAFYMHQVSIAAQKEHFGELHCTPPPRDRPHPKGVLDEDACGVQPLWPRQRKTEGWPVVLHLAWIGFAFCSRIWWLLCGVGGV